ncbi:MAG: hypothetical protein EDS66_14820 [Planctomycetota bacterium]|nr:MAG: hypothetical protein EDS66_14820 [Planctomycetota bacterium]
MERPPTGIQAIRRTARLSGLTEAASTAGFAELEPTGIEPATSWLQTSEHPSQNGVSDVETRVLGARCTPGCTATPQDMRLVLLLESLAKTWPATTEPMRAALEAMVKAAAPQLQATTRSAY